MLPFTRDQFFDLFATYNHAVFPAQFGLLLIALACLLLSARPRHGTGRWVAGFLAFLWLWMGVAYHLLFFTRINRAAFLFGGLFILQAGLFAWLALRREPPSFATRADLPGLVGGALVLYALALYPALGLMAGHHYPAAPTFGLPCPTTIFTFGVLLWSQSRLPAWLIVVPALWTLVGGSAALLLSVPQDLGLPLAGVASVLLLVRGRHRAGAAPVVPTVRAGSA